MTELVELNVRRTDIGGLLVLTMKQVTDARGTVREFFRTSAFEDAGIEAGPWLQVNVTETRRGAIRGLHGEDMTKLVAAASGRGFGAYVDARTDSPTFGAVEVLDLVPGTQVLVPPGVCNGFQACSDAFQYVYCFDREWQPGMAGVALTPFDAELAIEWPIDVDVTDPSLVSSKDASAPTLAQLRSSS